MLRTEAYWQGIQQHGHGIPPKVKREPQPYQSLWTPAAEQAADRDAVHEMLVKVDAAVQLEAHEAPRFTLRPGEALMVDNLRMLHGREGYASQRPDSERKMWRIWCWTDRSLGLPDGVAEFGSPVDAEKMLVDGE